jgi:Holliday junction resolvasome RuvABC endonuclease subunit
MIYLGVDQSYTSSGIVIFDVNLETTTVIHTEIFKTPKEMDIYQRAWKISMHIVDLCIKHSVQFVAIEGLAFGMRGDATRDLAGLQFTIITQLMCEHNIPVTVITPKSLKKFATDNGKATKKDMINALPPEVLEVFKGQGYKLTTGLADLADSYFLGSFLISQHKKS